MDRLDQMIHLMKVTGEDKCLFWDPEGQGYMVMRIPEPTKTEGSTDAFEDTFLEKVNEDIALWREKEENTPLTVTLEKDEEDGEENLYIEREEYKTYAAQ